jgi:hypothetical protein
MTPDYYRKLAATWQRLAELELNSHEKRRLQARAAECLLQAEEAEAERHAVPNPPQR